MTPEELEATVDTHPDKDVFKAVLDGVITLFQGRRELRRRAKARALPQRRMFLSLPTKEHMNRHDRRANAAQGTTCGAPRGHVQSHVARGPSGESENEGCAKEYQALVYDS